MNTTLVVLLLAAVAITVWMWLKRREDEPSASNLPWPYFAKRPLSTPEQVLYHRLITALPDHFILAQVQVSRVLQQVSSVVSTSTDGTTGSTG